LTKQLLTKQFKIKYCFLKKINQIAKPLSPGASQDMWLIDIKLNLTSIND